MKRLLGDDAESGAVRLGQYGEEETLPVTAGGHSRAVSVIGSFGALFRPAERSVTTGSGSGSGSRATVRHQPK